MSVAVLMYHGVGDAVASHAELRYTISEGSFASHLDALGGRPVATYEEFLAGRATPGAVVVTFDDGEATIMTRALPLLEARRQVAALFMTTAWIGTPGYLDADELRELVARGWTVGAHGHTHRYLTDADDWQLKAELHTSRDILTRILGRPPAHMSLPGGRWNSRVLAAVKEAGYLSLCNSVVALNSVRPDEFAVSRIAILRGFDATEVVQAADGDWRFFWKQQARKGLLDAAKRVLGNKRYNELRERVFLVRGTLRRLRGG